MTRRPCDPRDPEGDDGAPLVPACALTRRRFVGATAGLVLAGCGPAAMPAQKVPAVKDGILEFELGSIAELATPGGMVAVQPEGSRKPLIIMRLEGGQFRVLSSRCPHLGCTVRWDNEEQALRCACHNSQFSDDGKVVRGPAKQPLREYPSQLAGTTLQIAIRDD
jgi:cytochrome b6-f complex iron-sulfur subunit